METCLTCGKKFNWVPIVGGNTAIKCAQCAQAKAIQQSVRDSARAAERAASAASSSARIEEIREQARRQVEGQRRQEAAVRRAKEALEESYQALTKEKCPWCGKVEAHKATEDWVNLMRALEDIPSLKSGKPFVFLAENLMKHAPDWDAKQWDAIEELGPKLADPSRLGTFPYCSRKCRHDCLEAGEAGDDAALIESLQNTRKEAHILTVAALEKQEEIKKARWAEMIRAKEAKKLEEQEERKAEAHRKKKAAEKARRAHLKDRLMLLYCGAVVVFAMIFLSWVTD